MPAGGDGSPEAVATAAPASAEAAARRWRRVTAPAVAASAPLTTVAPTDTSCERRRAHHREQREGGEHHVARTPAAGGGDAHPGADGQGQDHDNGEQQRLVGGAHGLGRPPTEEARACCRITAWPTTATSDGTASEMASTSADTDRATVAARVPATAERRASAVVPVVGGRVATSIPPSFIRSPPSPSSRPATIRHRHPVQGLTGRAPGRARGAMCWLAGRFGV